MNGIKFGLLSVGMRSAPEILQYFKDSLPVKGAEFISKGALDDLSRDEVECMTADPEEKSVYVSYNGNPYDLSLAKIEQKLKEKSMILKSEGAEHIFLRCTAPFSEQLGKMSVLLPYPLLLGVVEALRADILGVIIPRKAQEEQCRQKWSACADSIICETVGPREPDRSFFETAERLAKSGAAVILMDCMGYRKEQQDLICHSFNKGPVLYAPAIYLSAAKEILYYLTRQNH